MKKLFIVLAMGFLILSLGACGAQRAAILEGDNVFTAEVKGDLKLIIDMGANGLEKARALIPFEKSIKARLVNHPELIEKLAEFIGLGKKESPTEEDKVAAFDLWMKYSLRVLIEALIKDLKDAEKCFDEIISEIKEE